MDTPHTPPGPAMVEDLTEREREVLRLKAQKRTNQEIADELVLAVSTVKWYVRQIYGKLGVENRRRAAARAKALGIIERTPSPGVRPHHNLPAQMTPFIGREQERADLDTLLADPEVRLITILAPGGMGKTRLGLAVAEAHLDRFADGVYIVPLAPLRAPDQIVTTIAEATHFPFVPDGRSPKQQVLDFLRNKHMLLLLDNFEHLLDGAGLVTEVLQVAPAVQVMVTSREGLNLSGEAIYTIGGLTFPEETEPGTLLTYEAAWLFIQRAELARPGFELHPDDLPLLARICRLVEGMPLGIVLAAAWMEVLSLADIADEIERSFDFLAAEMRDEPRRQWSIRAVFDPTWDRLTEVERNAFMQFAIFRGGATREAVQTVTDVDLRTLQALINRALLDRESTGRYGMHELLRQYAAEKLEQLPQIKQGILDRHSAYYTELLHRLESIIHLSNQAGVLEDLDNVRAAWKRAVQQRNLSALQQAAPSLYWLYHFQNWPDEGAAMFYLAEEAVSEMPMSDDVRFVLGMIQLLRCFYQPAHPGRVNYPPVDIDTALAHWEGLEERPEMGLPLTRAMLALTGKEPAQVIAAARNSLAFSKRHNDLSGAAISLTALANVYYLALGNIAEAQQFLKEALAVDREIGFDLNARWVESIMGDITQLQGRYAEAKAHVEASVVHHRVGGIPRGLDMTLVVLGNAALELNEDVAARAYFEESIALASSHQHHEVIAHGRAGLGIMAAFQGDVGTATVIYEDVYSYLQSVGIDAQGYNHDIENLGFLALLLGLYEQALLYYEAILSSNENTGYRVPLMCAHSRTGHALIGLGDEARAALYLFDALREAAAIGAFQVLLEALLGIAQLSLVTLPSAVELLAFVYEHSAANRFSRIRARYGLAMKETLLSQDSFAASLKRGQILTLESAVALVEPFGSDLEMAPPKLYQPLIDPLSQRELEVLVLIADGLTNQQIADRLYISVSTVKKHINHIYGKLDVTHRAQAVARARTLNILS